VTDFVVYYPRIAQAEQAILDAGYVRNNQRSVWVNPERKTAKVMREEPGKFYIQWS
jgi:hypothetical protein